LPLLSNAGLLVKCAVPDTYVGVVGTRV
jgi:hypothetical protein